MKFTHKILLLPVLAAFGFLSLAALTWRGNHESQELSRQIEDRFFADVELSLRLQNVALETRQEFSFAAQVDEEMGVEAADERAGAFRALVEAGLQRPQLEKDELLDILELYNGYHRWARPAVTALSNMSNDEFLEFSESDFAAIEEMNRLYDELTKVLRERTERSHADLEAALDDARTRRQRRQQVATWASIIGLVILVGVSTAVAASILTPLRSIMAGTEAIAAGDLYHKLEHESRDMLGRLADSFRKMQRSLVRDMNLRKSAEAALRTSEERLALAFDAANDGLWDLDVAGNDVYLSPKYYAILGYAPEESEGRVPALYELCRPEIRDEVRRQWRHHLQAGDPFDVELEIRREDGHWCWVHARGKIVEQDAAGSPRRSVGTIADVTAYRREAAGSTEPPPNALERGPVNGTGTERTAALLSDVGRPASLLIASAESVVSGAQAGGVVSEDRLETLEAARKRTATALRAAARVVELDEDAERVVELTEVISLAGVLAGCVVRVSAPGHQPLRLAQGGNVVRAVRHALADGPQPAERSVPIDIRVAVADAGDRVLLSWEIAGRRVELPVALSV